jgi:hypothetical protein
MAARHPMHRNGTPELDAVETVSIACGSGQTKGTEERSMTRTHASRHPLFYLPVVLAVALLGAGAALAADVDHTSSMFKGAKANTGTVTHSKMDGKQMLTLSKDFKVPDTPAPHWQVIDSKGNTYLLQRLVIKDDKYNQTITLPAYIKDVAKVQIWCAWAEALLGEASFAAPLH